MKRLLIIFCLMPYVAFAQVDTSMYQMGNSPYANYLRNSQQRPMAVYNPPPQPINPTNITPPPQPDFAPKNLPQQRICELVNNRLICY